MKVDGGSFRDPSGFVYAKNGVIYRQINKVYKNNYDKLMSSGLYDAAVSAGVLIPHQEDKSGNTNIGNCYKVIKPQKVNFISYPYEWCFSQLKNAALATLKLQRMSLDYGMTLKDSSSYNIQFYNGSPVFIDTLSFEEYYEGEPWKAYRQFCQHFLSPLMLMSTIDVQLNQLLRANIDGIPIELTSAILPVHTYFRLPFLIHIHFHARSAKKYAKKQIKLGSSSQRFSKNAFIGLIDSLERTVKGLRWEPVGTEWASYYEDTNYSNNSIKIKKSIVYQYIKNISPSKVWDFGANNGRFSRLASQLGIDTISLDIDPGAIEKAYLSVEQDGLINLLPLVLDLTNPSPGIGWQNNERSSLIDRGPVELGMALALIHHLAISNNIPLDKIAEFFYKCCTYLIIEFIPKNDSQVERLLASRDDIFNDYTQERFETIFDKYFVVLERELIKDTKRTLYLMKAKQYKANGGK